MNTALISILLFLILDPINCSIEDKHSEENQLFSDKHNYKYLWGTYKPNLYFSMKQKKKETPVFGLMWYGVDVNTKSNKVDIDSLLKHECDQKNKIKYYWPFHNGIDYANEIIKDEENNVLLDIKNIKTNYSIQEQSWSTLITGKKIKNNNQKTRNLGLILYFSLENFPIEQKVFYKTEKIDERKYKLTGTIKGNEFAKFDIGLLKGDKNLKYSNYQKYRKSYEYNWKVKHFVLDDLKSIQGEYVEQNKTYSYIPFDELGKTKQPNIVAIQLVFSLNDIKDDNFEVLIQFSTNLNKKNNNKEELQDLINKKIEDFNTKFESLFKIKNVPDNYKYILDEKNNESLNQMSKEALSNILGGIGYFYGKIKIKDDKNNEKEMPEKGLFTATPCRSYFARGFLWDEGFHQTIISKWDIELSLEMVNTWFDTMDEEGWLPREQIRGPEAESQVPDMFISQDRLIANPPTLIFPIKFFVEYYKYHLDSEKDFGLKELLKKFYTKLKLWLNWFDETQRSPLSKKNLNEYKFTYQWNKRDSSHNFPSGFDDLPRGMTPNNEENHLDLNIWLLELEKTLEILSSYFDKESIDYHKNNIKERIENINKKLFSKELNIYSDYLGPQFKKISVSKYPRKVFPYLWRNDNQCGEKIKNPIGTRAECNPYSDSPCCSEFGWCGNTPGHCNCPKCNRSHKLEERNEYKKKENTYNPHIGYINLFPLFFGDFAQEKTGKLFDYLKGQNELLCEYGLRSLSKNDLLYHTGDNYWRGKIWIQMNYLTLSGLFKYYIDKNDSAKTIYNKVRKGVIKAVYKSWEKSHVFYENYDDESGQGVMNNPFNGWTSTILLILSENYN